MEDEARSKSAICLRTRRADHFPMRSPSFFDSRIAALALATTLLAVIACAVFFHPVGKPKPEGPNGPAGIAAVAQTP
jgi:hypothetical protein